MPNLAPDTCSRPLAAAIFLAIGLTAQEPNVLPLARDFHVGIYASEIEIPNGAERLFGGMGLMTWTPNGFFSGSLDAFETYVNSSTVALPNDPFSGAYSVRGDGICMMDQDLLNPGTELEPLWINADGSVLHGVSSSAMSNSASILAIQTGSGLSNSTISGDYRIVGQRVEFDTSTSSGWRAEHEHGVVTFDGVGNGTVNGIKTTFTGVAGAPQPFSSTFTYSVANNGALTIGGGSGACSADGELLFVVVADATGDVGMIVGVRVGSSYDLQDLAGRLSFTGHRYELGPTSTVLPRTTTTFGELSLAASTTTTGSWGLVAAVVETTPSGTMVSASTASGAAALGGAGLAASELTLSDAARTWSLWSSAAGQFYVGREPGPNAHQLFAMRQCPASVPVGSGTIGTGGEEPRLGMRTFPQLGNAQFAFAIEGGVGGAICAIPMATAAGPAVPAFGGSILIDITAIGTTAVVVLDGTPGAAGEGTGLAPVPIPNSLALIGFELWGQALVFDSAATGGVALSNAYQAIVCR